jgi:hypothetical protein
MDHYQTNKQAPDSPPSNPGAHDDSGSTFLHIASANEYSIPVRSGQSLRARMQLLLELLTRQEGALYFLMMEYLREMESADIPEYVSRYRKEATREARRLEETKALREELEGALAEVSYD